MSCDRGVGAASECNAVRWSRLWRTPTVSLSRECDCQRSHRHPSVAFMQLLSGRRSARHPVMWGAGAARIAAVHGRGWGCAWRECAADAAGFCVILSHHLHCSRLVSPLASLRRDVAAAQATAAVARVASRPLRTARPPLLVRIASLRTGPCAPRAALLCAAHCRVAHSGALQQLRHGLARHDTVRQVHVAHH